MLDLNLPGTDGREVLAVVKSEPSLLDIPVVVMTTSEDDRDVEACYRHGVNSYLNKPVDIDALQRSVSVLAEYWFQTVILPRRRNA